jgi:hypothetical protein
MVEELVVAAHQMQDAPAAPQLRRLQSNFLRGNPGWNRAVQG